MGIGCKGEDGPDAHAIARSLRQVQERIVRAARKVDRHPDAVRLVAVTKSVQVERIRMALDAGIRIFGENRLQEALPKLDALRDVPGVTWHFIGQLQRRKVKAVVGQFALIHSVASVELAAEIDRCAKTAGVTQSVLLEVNIDQEPTKAGFFPEALWEKLPAFEPFTHVAVKGLMTIPPRHAVGESARPYFRRLKDLAESLGRRQVRHLESPDPRERPERFQGFEMVELSMGMSQDYEVAVEEGATFVRVGTAIFGERDA